MAYDSIYAVHRLPSATTTMCATTRLRNAQHKKNRNYQPRDVDETLFATKPRTKARVTSRSSGTSGLESASSLSGFYSGVSSITPHPLAISLSFLPLRGKAHTTQYRSGGTVGWLWTSAGITSAIRCVLLRSSVAAACSKKHLATVVANLKGKGKCFSEHCNVICRRGELCRTRALACTAGPRVRSQSILGALQAIARF